MGCLTRQSPVAFADRAVKTEIRSHWPVVLAYEHEGSGPWLIDLCHKTRWDLQDGRLGDQKPGGIAIPQVPGECRLERQIIVSRVGPTQAAVWHLGGGGAPELPSESGYTDISEASLFLALFGPAVFYITEKLTDLDFMDRARQAPFLYQGPFAHVPCQIVTMAREIDGTGGLLITCSRGYAKDMVHAILKAGAVHGLRPAGEDRFTAWLASFQA